MASDFRVTLLNSTGNLGARLEVDLQVGTHFIVCVIPMGSTTCPPSTSAVALAADPGAQIRMFVTHVTSEAPHPVLVSFSWEAKP